MSHLAEPVLSFCRKAKTFSKSLLTQKNVPRGNHRFRRNNAKHHQLMILREMIIGQKIRT
mgnify:CR=1 FL=1